MPSLFPERFHTSSRVLMVRPIGFAYHESAAETNVFMHEPTRDDEKVAADAQREFDGLASALRDAGVEVVVYEEHEDLPDSVFPNNWFSYHTPVDGEPVLVTYPMNDVKRRRERRAGVLGLVGSEMGDPFTLIDLSPHEADDLALEGTGSLVIDRCSGVAIACVSARTDVTVIRDWESQTGGRVVLFRAASPSGEEVYHTNVIASFGEGFAVLCEDSVDRGDLERVRDELTALGKEIIPITWVQVLSMCGNMLQLRNSEGEPLIAMSSAAHGALTNEQRETLSRHGRLVHAPIPTIEHVGGGSVRCMIAEIGRAANHETH